MIEEKSLLIVGGTKRNIGKTTLIERIINKFSSEYNIVAFKIKTIYPNDSFFHGKDSNPLRENENYRITEEIKRIGIEDTNRMLNAGAKRVFKIKTKAGFITDAYNELKEITNKKTLLICESNTLRKEIIPSLFLFVKEDYSDEMKPSASEVIKLADKIILTNGKVHKFDLQEIIIRKNKWKIKKQ